MAAGFVLVAVSAQAREDGGVAQAIVRATLDRVGPAAVQADVDVVSASLGASSDVVAVPDPQGTIGTPTRFALLAGGKRVGSAVATVRVRARVVRTVKFVARHEAIDADAVSLVEQELTGFRYAHLPQLADVVGGRARRDLERDEPLSANVVVTEPAVRTGDRVRVELTVGRIHLTSDGVASGSGEVGERVRVLPAGRRTLLKAKVIDRGVVEVVP